MTLKDTKPVLIQDISTKLWNEFAGEAKKRGKKVPEAAEESFTFWLEHPELFAKIGK